jgi:hypothetical protein
VGGKLTQGLVSQSVDFCLHAFEDVSAEAQQAVLAKLDHVKADRRGGNGDNDTEFSETAQDLEKLSEDELAVLRTIRARQMMRTEDAMNIDGFAHDVIDGFVPRLVRGRLGLNRVAVQSRAAAAAEYSGSLFEAGLSEHSVVADGGLKEALRPEGAVEV